jgi:uncharacterized RDD family membrane protein YckC
MQTGPNPYAPPAADLDFGVTKTTSDDLLADPGSRLGARVIDGILVAAASAPALVLQFVFDRIEFLLLCAITIPVLLAYQWYLAATIGQSLGKRWLRIKVVKTSGGPLDFASAVVARLWVPALLASVPGIGQLFLLADALFIFRDDRRCLHDFLAGTRVVAT